MEKRISQELNMYEINLSQNGKHIPSYISVIVYTNDKGNHHWNITLI